MGDKTLDFPMFCATIRLHPRAIRCATSLGIARREKINPKARSVKLSWCGNYPHV